MRITVQVVIENDDERPPERHDVARLDRGDLDAGTVGLQLAEAKQLLASVQEVMVAEQVRACLDVRGPCPDCGRARRHKDARAITLRTAFGRLRLESPRWHHCPCRRQERKTFSPLAKKRSSSARGTSTTATSASATGTATAIGASRVRRPVLRAGRDGRRGRRERARGGWTRAGRSQRAISTSRTSPVSGWGPVPRWTSRTCSCAQIPPCAQIPRISARVPWSGRSGRARTSSSSAASPRDSRRRCDQGLVDLVRESQFAVRIELLRVGAAPLEGRPVPRFPRDPRAGVGGFAPFAPGFACGRSDGFR